MKKIVAMIPARIGSKRVPKKNLRLLNGKPLISYSIEAALASAAFDEIYINSDSEIFSEIAEYHGVKFYKRPKSLGSDETINDEFAHDFIKNISGDILVQLLPTSPLITSKEICEFARTMLDHQYDTLVSVENKQIACLYEGKPINFSSLEPHKSSQTMIPVQAYATVLMAWTYSSFLKNMKKYGFAYHGANGRIGYYELKGLATIDVDHEEDFQIVEIALRYRDNQADHRKEYYESSMAIRERAEVDVMEILNRDGVANNDFQTENQHLVNLDTIIANKQNGRSWSYRIINTENNSATLIAQLPGEGNRLHYHPDWNEWWYIVDGEWKWEIENKEFLVKKGDLVFIEKNKKHRITAMGQKPAIRLAVSRDRVAHVYSESDH